MEGGLHSRRRENRVARAEEALFFSLNFKLKYICTTHKIDRGMPTRVKERVGAEERSSCGTIPDCTRMLSKQTKELRYREIVDVDSPCTCTYDRLNNKSNIITWHSGYAHVAHGETPPKPEETTPHPLQHTPDCRRQRQ